MTLPCTANLNKDDRNDGNVHMLTFPFGLTERPDGGLPTVILNEVANSAGKEVVMFTKDAEAHDNWQGVKIAPASPGAMPPELFKAWFGTGYWPTLHPKAHTSETLTPDAVKAMYPADKAAVVSQELEAEYRAKGRNPSEIPQVGSPEFMVRYVAKYAPSQSVNDAFNDTFSGVIEKELSTLQQRGSDLRFNFQDYFFSPTVGRFAPRIREMGGRSTYHLHTTIPALPETEALPAQIVDLARGASKADVVLTHTEAYNDRLRVIFDRLKLPVPELRTFALGIDEADLARRQDLITPANYHQTIPSLKSMTPRQQALIHAAFDAERMGVPHQFGMFDRLDPGKGLDTVFLAIDDFLTRARSHMSIDSIRQSFRFFALLSLFPSDAPADTSNMKDAYGWHVKQLGEALERKWPGVFMMAEGLSGKQRDLICALMRGRTVITGGSEDGLNQVVMESAFINRDRPTGVIAGENIGFVMEMDRANLKHNLLSFSPGNVNQLVERINQVVGNPAALVGPKQAIVRAIEARRDSMLIDG